MPEVLSRRQLEILEVMRRLARERTKGEVSTADVAQALYGEDRDLTACYSLLQGEIMDLAERGLVEQSPSLHEWRLTPGVL
jgi:DNA-binding IclR family transcriptional regulator